MFDGCGLFLSGWVLAWHSVGVWRLETATRSEATFRDKGTTTMETETRVRLGSFYSFPHSSNSTECARVARQPALLSLAELSASTYEGAWDVNPRWGCGWKKGTGHRGNEGTRDSLAQRTDHKKSTALPCSSILACPVASTWEEAVAGYIVSSKKGICEWRGTRNSQAVTRSPKDGLGRKRSREERRERKAGLSLRKQALSALHTTYGIQRVRKEEKWRVPSPIARVWVLHSGQRGRKGTRTAVWGGGWGVSTWAVATLAVEEGTARKEGKESWEVRAQGVCGRKRCGCSSSGVGVSSAKCPPSFLSSFPIVSRFCARLFALHLAPLCAAGGDVLHVVERFSSYSNQPPFPPSSLDRFFLLALQPLETPALQKNRPLLRVD